MGLFRRRKRDVEEPAEKAAVKRGYVDDYLRAFGFVIFERAQGFEAIWKRDGHYYSETDAWIIAKRQHDEAEAKKDAVK